MTRPLPQATSLSGDQWRAIERARDFLRVAAAGPRTLVAVTLASIWSGALILSCDECARSRYNHQPGAYRVLPLSAYRDWYAEARSHVQDAVAVMTAEVIDDASAAPAAPSPAPVVPQAATISARGPAPAPTVAASGPCRYRADRVTAVL